MNKQKLIGTIIGVIFFVALIAGATFAWLTFNATVTNGTYNGSTRNFVINYTKGTDITTEPPHLSDVTVSNVASSGAASLVVKAGKSNANGSNGKIDILINTNEETTLDLSSGVFKYAVSINGATPSAIKSLTNATQTVVVDDDVINSTTQKTYTIYFWIDASVYNNNYLNKKYSGYISASATQTES